MTSTVRTGHCRRLLLSLLALLALVAASCGGDDDDTSDAAPTVTAASEEGASSGAGSESATPSDDDPPDDELGAASSAEEPAEPAPEPDEPEPPAADPDTGTGEGTVESAMLPVEASGEAIVGMANSVPGLEFSAFPNFGFMAFYGLYLEGLVAWLPDGTIGPRLASDWQFSDDRRSVTFNLRSGVEFSDGTDFTSADVVANFESMQERGLGPNALALAAIESMETPDDYTVVLNLRAPDPFVLLKQLAGLPGLIVSSETLGGDPADYSGTGPWTLEEFRPGDALIYEARSEYYNPQDVKIQRIEFVSGELPALAQGLAAGDLDGIGFIPLFFVRDIPNAEPLTRRGGNSVAVIITDPYGEKIPGLATREGRCAVMSAINRQQVGAGLGNPPSNEVINGNYPGHIGDYAGEGAYDAQGAADRLAAAGITDLGVTGAFGLLNNVAGGVVASFEAAGVSYGIEAIEAPESNRALGEGRYPVQVIAMSEPAIQLIQQRALGPGAPGDGIFNSSGYEAPGVREAYEAARAAAATNDEAGFNDAMADAFRAMYDDCLWTGLFVGSNNSVVDSTKISGADTRLDMPLGIWLRGAEAIG